MTSTLTRRDSRDGPKTTPYSEGVGRENEGLLAACPDLMEVEGEVSVPKAVGNLPMLPCLHNAIMVENPAHEARYYLVQWFRDLLTGRTNILSRSEQEKILDAIVDEIEHIVTNTDEIWLDWNREKTNNILLSRYIKT